MGFSVFLLMLRIILLCLLAYFGLGYGCIRLYETMTFYVPFSKELAANNVYNKSTQRKLIKGYATPFVGMVLIALVLTVVLVILAFLLGLFLSRLYSSWFDRSRKAESPAEETVAKATADDLQGLIAGAGLVLESADDGTRTVRGDFARLADRLEFAAAAYRLDPDLKLDLADDETLRAGAEELVFLLTEGRIKVEAATNRTVTLVGRSKSREALLETVAALCADVNRVKTIDDTRVVCEDGERSRAPTAFKAASASNPFAPPARRGIVPPKCPVAGVIVTPYPCLVMRDGSRLAPGAMIGEWTVVGITETEVTIRNGETEYKWKP